MAPSVELRCPGCTEFLGRFRRARFAVGRPFEECPKCRTFVHRPSTDEWDLLGFGARSAWIAASIAPFAVLGLLPALAYWALVFRDGRGEPGSLLALACAGPALSASFAVSAVLHAIRRSRARMTDPMYRARLIEFRRRTP